MWCIIAKNVDNFEKLFQNIVFFYSLGNNSVTYRFQLLDKYQFLPMREKTWYGGKGTGDKSEFKSSSPSI